MNWHYEKNGVRHDNVTEADITERIQRGEPHQLLAAALWQHSAVDNP